MKNFDDYFANAARALRGLTSLEVTLGLTHVTKIIYEPIYLDAKDKHRLFTLARAGRRVAFRTLKDERADSLEYLEGLRDYLTGFFGSTWSEEWQVLGFTNTSLELPRKVSNICTIFENVAEHFENHPEHENAAKEYTKAKVEEVCGPLTAAATNVENAKFETRSKLDLRKPAIRLLDKKLADLRRELETVLAPTDPLWLKFFDRIPGDERVPERVVGLSASVVGNVLMADWPPDVPRAARFKVFKQVVGLDPAPVLADTVEDNDAQFPVNPGTVVKLFVVANNGRGDAAPSEVLEVAA